MPRGIPNAPTAQANPVILTKTLEAAEQQIGQNTELNMPVDGPLADMVRTDQDIQIVDGPGWQDKAAALAFNEEVIEIMVHDSTDKNASKLVDVYNGGIPQRFIRGQPQRVKRKFVEVLARAKPVGLVTSVSHGDDGEVYNKISKSAALAYPFSVIRDDNPKGAPWLTKILAEA
jgi:hypothetical protein